MSTVLDDRVVEVTAMSTRSPSCFHSEIAQPDMQVAILRMAASYAQLHRPRSGHWYQNVGTRGCMALGRSKRGLPRPWLSDSPMHGLAEVDWRHERTEAAEGSV